MVRMKFVQPRIFIMADAGRSGSGARRFVMLARHARLDGQPEALFSPLETTSPSTHGEFPAKA